MLSLVNDDFLRDVSGMTDEEMQEAWVKDEAKALAQEYFEGISNIEGSLGVEYLTSKSQLHEKLKQQVGVVVKWGVAWHWH